MTGRNNLLDLAAQHQEIRRVVFPEATSRIELNDLRKIIQYALVEGDSPVNAKLFFEKYLDELSARGRHSAIFFYKFL
jgi:protein gp37